MQHRGVVPVANGSARKRLVSWINTILKSTRTDPRRRIEPDTQLSGINKKLKKEYGHKTRFSAPNNMPFYQPSTLQWENRKKTNSNRFPDEHTVISIGQKSHEKSKRPTLLWVPSQVGIPGNKKADSAAKEALDEQLEKTEEYLPPDLAKWISQQLEENQQTHWE
jgi:hypothetical protein